MHTRHHLIQQHHEWAHAHQTHANALQQQAHFHHQQALFHQHQAMSHTEEGMTEGRYTTTNPLMTAYNNQVSPTALVYNGSVSPQSMSSLRQFQNQFSSQSGADHHVHLSNHMAHATDNHAAMQRGYKF